MRRQVLPLLENFILQQLDQFCNNGNLHSVDTNIKLPRIQISNYSVNKYQIFPEVFLFCCSEQNQYATYNTNLSASNLIDISYHGVGNGWLTCKRCKKCKTLVMLRNTPPPPPTDRVDRCAVRKSITSHHKQNKLANLRRCGSLKLGTQFEYSLK